MHNRPIIASLDRRARFGVAAVLAVLGCGPLSTAGAAEPARAPDTDGLCAWGRLSDGHGRLIRCLTKEDTARLREAAPAPTASAPPMPPAQAPSAVPPAAPEAREPAPTSEVAPATPAPPAPAPAAPPPEAASLEVEIGPAVPDSGALPDAQKNLLKARDRYTTCVEKNGGLSLDRGTVELRFLVQGLGRAEGVSVKKHRGMSEASAKCIANVVDRRYVGYPDEPAVGVTVVVTLSKKKR